MQPVLKVGLTGGIGSGKSTVSRLLAAKGAVVVDADRLAREVVAPGTPGLAAVVAAFGDQVLQPDGTLDREGLGRLVFGDPERRATLNAIVHPLVAAGMDEAEQEAVRAGAAVVVHDVPLLAENGLRALYDAVVVVDCPVETQLDRLVTHRGMHPEDARARVAAQATRAQRLAVADHVITNDGSLAELEQAVDEVWAALTAARPAQSSSSPP